MSRLFGVVGDPVFHSKSPLLFNTAFHELSLDAQYVRIAASSADEAMALVREIGIEGINVTSPFKTDMAALIDRIEGDAVTIGSVNTVVREGDAYVGYNTDRDGVSAAVSTVLPDLSGVKAVVLGAEGAAKAAALALISAGAHVVLVNRTFKKAVDAAALLTCAAMPMDALAEALTGARLLVSAVSADARIVAPKLLTKGLAVLDANYGKPTALIQDATKAGCIVIDGREWLLGQALPAFQRFTGQTAPADAMHKALMKRRIDSRRNIALIGFMGTGKTVVARELGKLSGMPVIEIDKRIEEKAGVSVSEIFEKYGEAEFRRLEQEEIEEARLDTEQIISCGGGAVVSKTNVRVLRNNCISVWLWAGAETVLERTSFSDTRPLLRAPEPEKAIQDLLSRRIPLYARTSDLLVGTRDRSPKEIALRIWNEIRHAFQN